MASLAQIWNAGAFSIFIFFYMLFIYLSYLTTTFNEFSILKNIPQLVQILNAIKITTAIKRVQNGIGGNSENSEERVW